FEEVHQVLRDLLGSCADRSRIAADRRLATLDREEFEANGLAVDFGCANLVLGELPGSACGIELDRRCGGPDAHRHIHRPEIPTVGHVIRLASTQRIYPCDPLWRARILVNSAPSKKIDAE